MVDARKNTVPPESLMKALGLIQLKYTDTVALYYCISIGIDAYCGVFGDGVPRECFTMLNA